MNNCKWGLRSRALRQVEWLEGHKDKHKRNTSVIGAASLPAYPIACSSCFNE